ncbi:AbrB/MazE/SpoVT family DNA-binding domain-containing protein [Georgenia sp. TF02-10]|uniref:AbrB/MazE/SpoVT family DNA-binding domain-containing protein n=1 Tax=Georgenia sp. TF02-10 TaxID=2917725 RepID=UPI001FA7A517|nr:AbrB/MazE/SpoVT family DNA-binding domain-containing protein [Georgenia sp. TF02-10]UNX55317.1 AbrB/MazE/SpoVT family DNA-binding domain-containing protein [Georgenia sp. TF02-10]
MKSLRVRLDERGRLQLPAAVRHRLGLSPGDEVVVIEEPDGARLVSTPVAARALIGIAGKLDHSAVDELRQLRAREAADEDSVARQQR